MCLSKRASRAAIARRSKERSTGVALIEVAVLLPVLLILGTVIFDLMRLYVNAIYVRQIALLTLKLSSSTDPDGYAFLDSDYDQLLRAAPGETSTTTDKREAYWTNMFVQGHDNYIGMSVNCSIRMDFAGGDDPPIPLPDSSASNYAAVMSANRDRMYTVRCIVPVISHLFLPFLFPDQFKFVRYDVYVNRGGSIRA